MDVLRGEGWTLDRTWFCCWKDWDGGLSVRRKSLEW